MGAGGVRVRRKKYKLTEKLEERGLVSQDKRRTEGQSPVAVRQKSLNVLSCNKLINRKVKNHFCVLLSRTHTARTECPGGVWQAGRSFANFTPSADDSVSIKGFSHCAYHALYPPRMRPRPICSLFLSMVSPRTCVCAIFPESESIGRWECVCVQHAKL